MCVVNLVLLPQLFCWHCKSLDLVLSQQLEILQKSHDKTNNLLKQAPHTLEIVTGNNWDRPYSRKQAAFPLKDQIKNKYWPTVSRIDNAFGDRNLVCTCDPIDEYGND